MFLLFCLPLDAVFFLALIYKYRVFFLFVCQLFLNLEFLLSRMQHNTQQQNIFNEKITYSFTPPSRIFSRHHHNHNHNHNHHDHRHHNPSKLVIGSPQLRNSKQQQMSIFPKTQASNNDLNSEHSSHNSHTHSHSHESHGSVNAPVFDTNSSVKMFSVLDRSTSSMSLYEARIKNKELGMKELDDRNSETDASGSASGEENGNNKQRKHKKISDEYAIGNDI